MPSILLSDSECEFIAATLTEVADGDPNRDREAIYRRLAAMFRRKRALEPLTLHQAKLLDYVADYLDLHGYAPNYEEIAHGLGYRSGATVHEHLQNLQRKGYVRILFNEARGITVLARPPRANLSETVSP